MKNRTFLPMLFIIDKSNFVDGTNLYTHNQYELELSKIKLEIRQLRSTLLVEKDRLWLLNFDRNRMALGSYWFSLLPSQIAILENRIASIKCSIEDLEDQIRYKENLYSLCQHNQYVNYMIQELTDKISRGSERIHQIEIPESQTLILKLLKELHVQNCNLIELKKDLIKDLIQSKTMSSNRYFSILSHLNQLYIDLNKSQIAALENQITILYKDILNQGFYIQSDCTNSIKIINTIRALNESFIAYTENYYGVYGLNNAYFFNIKVKTFIKTRWSNVLSYKPYEAMRNLVPARHVYNNYLVINDLIITKYWKLKHFFETDFLQNEYQIRQTIKEGFRISIHESYRKMEKVSNQMIKNSQILITKLLSWKKLSFFSLRFNNLTVHSPPRISLNKLEISFI